MPDRLRVLKERERADMLRGLREMLGRALRSDDPMTRRLAVVNNNIVKNRLSA